MPRENQGSAHSNVLPSRASKGQSCNLNLSWPTLRPVFCPVYHIHLLLKLAAFTTGLVHKGPRLRLNDVQGDPQDSLKVKEEETEAHRGQVTSPKSQGSEEVDLRSETPSGTTTRAHALSRTA